MIAAMHMHGFSAHTHESYLAAVRGLAKYTRRSPDTLKPADLKRYFEYLVRERQLAPASVRLAYNGIRFFYLQVLAWPAVDLEVTLPKRAQIRLDESFAKYLRILAAIDRWSIPSRASPTPTRSLTTSGATATALR
nr:site-specific integrase [Halorhodospira abdelmalekii]